MCITSWKGMTNGQWNRKGAEGKAEGKRQRHDRQNDTERLQEKTY